MIFEIIELGKTIYIYTKESLKEEFGDPPLFINEKIRECKQLYTADLMNDHRDLSIYF